MSQCIVCLEESLPLWSLCAPDTCNNFKVHPHCFKEFAESTDYVCNYCDKKYVVSLHEPDLCDKFIFGTYLKHPYRLIYFLIINAVVTAVCVTAICFGYRRHRSS